MPRPKPKPNVRTFSEPISEHDPFDETARHLAGKASCTTLASLASSPFSSSPPSSPWSIIGTPLRKRCLGVPLPLTTLEKPSRNPGGWALSRRPRPQLPLCILWLRDSRAPFFLGVLAFFLIPASNAMVYYWDTIDGASSWCPNPLYSLGQPVPQSQRAVVLKPVGNPPPPPTPSCCCFFLELRGIPAAV
jgi:hypothetical protein